MTRSLRLAYTALLLGSASPLLAQTSEHDAAYAVVTKLFDGMRARDTTAMRAAFVQLDGNLASIWVDYWFFIGDRLSHCGVDAIHLATQGGT